MPPLHFIKPTFAGGEYAPSMYSRVDVQRYTSGVKKLLNMIVHPSGGASNRPGWHFVAMAKYADRKFRLHDFQFSSTQTYTLEIGHQYIRFYTNNGQIAISSADAWLTSTAYVVGNYVTQGGIIYYCIANHTSGTFATDLGNGDWTAQTIYEIPTPYNEADLPALNFTQSADVLFIFSPIYQTRQLNRMGSTNWTLTLYDFLFGPVQIPNSDTTFTITPSATSGSGVTLTSSSALFDPLHVGGLFQINHVLAEQSITDSLASATSGTSILCGGTWRLITNGTWTGTIAVQKSTDGGSTWTNIRSFSSVDDFNVNTFGTEDMSNNAPAFLVRLNMSAHSSGTCSYTLSADAFRNVGYIKITAYSSATSVTGTVTKLLGATTSTFDWAEGSWSDLRGWPAVGEFNQDRLVTANTENEPQTIWQTKASNYYDYSTSSPLVDSDSISTRIPSRQLNGVNGFVPLNSLIALTSSSEWGIGAVDVVMSPLTITQKPFGFDGSSGLKPVIIKNRAVYVQFMGAVILDLGYELVSNSFTGANLSILANHLFDGFSIVDMCYQQYPDSIVWCVRNDGVLLSMTYLREQEVIAWAHHETNGIVETIASIPSNGYNQVWLGVKRGDNRYIEYMEHRMASTLPEDQFFVDCGISFDGNTPDSFVKLYLAFDGINNSTIFLDGNTIPKTVTPHNAVLISTDESKFGGSSGEFLGSSGNDGLTKLLLHCDGADGSTTFTDSEASPKTVTANGGARITTSKSVFGGASAVFNSGIDSSTVLMLHCDGSNSGTTFTDASTSAHTMTAHGGAITSTDTAQFGATSAKIVASSTSYVDTPHSTDFEFGTGDFTIDCWINPNSVGSTVGLVTYGSGAGNDWLFLIAPTGEIRFYAETLSILCDITSVGANIQTGVWTHVTAVRHGTVILLFVNGILQTTTGTQIGSASLITSTLNLSIGIRGTNNDLKFDGYIDEIRISKGIARWTANFIPAVTAYGAGDYLSMANSTDFDFGAGDFTIDWRMNLNSIKGQMYFQKYQDGSNVFEIYSDTNGGDLVITVVTGGVEICEYFCGFSPVVGTWYHIAFVRNGTNIFIFINGVSQSLTINTAIGSQTIGTITGSTYIGHHASSVLYSFDGFMDEFRVSKGLARWVANFTPPMAAYSAPGYLSLTNSADFDFGAGAFTIDVFVNPQSIKAAAFFQKYQNSNNFFTFGTDATGNNLNLIVTTGSTLIASYSCPWNPVVDTWYHLAIVRSGTNIYIFINGVVQSLTVTQAIGASTIGSITGLEYIGQDAGSGNYFFDGFMDELKIAKGVARWTTNFTPPIVPGFQLPSKVITGLDYLNGYVVSILADGVVQPQQTVASGQITLNNFATKVHVGLPYTSDLETLNIDVNLPDGTMQGRKIKVSKAVIRMQNSKGGYIGPDENTLKQLQGVFNNYQSSTALFTGDLKHTLGGGYTDGGRIFIRQTDPLPITILALMPLISIGGTTIE